MTLPASIRAQEERAARDLALLERIKPRIVADQDLPPAVVLRNGSSYKPEAVSWLWHGWLAAGKLAILGGQPGTGKTTIALALAAVVTNGGSWPDGKKAERGSVAIWSGEDDASDTIMPRLYAARADVSRVHIIEGVRQGRECRPFDPAKDSEALAAALGNIPDLRLLIIDPIVSAVAGDSHKNAEVRRGLQPLVDIASRHRCALLGITHFTKGTAGREPVERITGSLAFGALARLVLVTAKAEAKDGEPARRFIARAKSNIGPDGGGFVYDLKQVELASFPGVESSHVVWGAALQGTARELLAAAEVVEDESGTDAAGFLRELLHFGAMTANEIYKQAGQAGFSQDAMKRAKKKMGVVAVKDGMVGGWRWQLPSVEGGEECAEGSEGSAQNYPLPSHSSESKPLPSGELEAFEL